MAKDSASTYAEMRCSPRALRISRCFLTRSTAGVPITPSPLPLTVRIESVKLVNERSLIGTVNLGRGLAGKLRRGGGRHDTRCQVTLYRLPLSGRGHQLRRLAVLPLSAQSS